MRPLDCKVNCVSHNQTGRVERSVPLPAGVGPLPQSLHRACQRDVRGVFFSNLGC